TNFCADLLSMERLEAFPMQLLGGPRGDWIAVRELCARLGIDANTIDGNLFATWLADPSGNDDYVTIIFYDADAEWTMAATYNRRRLLGTATIGRAEEIAKLSE